MELVELLRLAEHALSESQSTVEERLAMVDAYSKGFEAWLVAQGGEAGLASGRISKEDLMELASKHAAVLSLAETLKSRNVADLKSLESRGRAILAYVGNLPGRIGRIKEKKG